MLDRATNIVVHTPRASRSGLDRSVDNSIFCLLQLLVPTNQPLSSLLRTDTTIIRRGLLVLLAGSSNLLRFYEDQIYPAEHNPVGGQLTTSDESLSSATDPAPHELLSMRETSPRPKLSYLTPPSDSPGMQLDTVKAPVCEMPPPHTQHQSEAASSLSAAACSLITVNVGPLGLAEALPSLCSILSTRPAVVRSSITILHSQYTPSSRSDSGMPFTNASPTIYSQARTPIASGLLSLLQYFSR